MARKRSSEGASDRDVVSFRIDKDTVERLTVLADKEGQSVSLLARQMVIDRLDASGAVALQTDLLALREEVARLHANLRVVCQVLLTDAGRAEPEEAEAFAREQLK